MSNCKVGDLAIVVKSWAGNEGKIVRIVGDAGVVNWREMGYQQSWRIDQTLLSDRGAPKNRIADIQLNPLRDQDGEDEMLRIAGKPQENIIDACDRLVRELQKIADAAKELQK